MSKSEKDHFDRDEDEKRHFARIVASFRSYSEYTERKVERSLSYFRKLSSQQRSFLYDFEANCAKVRKCLNANDDVIKLIIEDVDEMFENSVEPSETSNETNKNKIVSPASDIERVLTTLRQIVRDWTTQGTEERNSSYGLILKELKNRFPNVKSQTNKDGETVRVLVPGCGLARLAFEIAILGFVCQGNEFSLHMLIASNFIMNKCYEAEYCTIYPFVHNWSNNMNFEDQVRPVKFPDVSPSHFTHSLSQFSMTAGEFLEIYNEEAKWDCVATCFFIDTAHNICDYIERIFALLVPGGLWLNFGPLLYHFADMPHEPSIELNYEQVKRVIEGVGFKFLKEETRVKSSYLDNEQSMLRYSYESVFFVVEKPILS